MEVGRDLVRSGGSEGWVEGGLWRWRGRLVRVNYIEMCLIVVRGIDGGTVGLDWWGRGRGRGRLIQRIVEKYRDGDRSWSHQVEGRLRVTRWK